MYVRYIADLKKHGQLGGVVSATLRIVILCKHSIRVDILKQDSILENKCSVMTSGTKLIYQSLLHRVIWSKRYRGTPDTPQHTRIGNTSMSEECRHM